MRVTITTSGSRGDVEPYLALAVALKDAGEEVTVAAPEEFAEEARSRGIRFWGIGYDPRETTEWMLRRGAGLINFARSTGGILAPVFEGMAREYAEACEGTEAIVYTPIGFMGHAIAEAAGLPRFGATVQPVVARTSRFPNAFVPALPGGISWEPRSSLAGYYNRASHLVAEQALWQAIRRPFNQAVRKVLGLDGYPLFGPFGGINRLREPGALGWSPSVLPKPLEWGPERTVTGYWFLEPRPGWEPPKELVEFLESGPKPISIGFGSMNDWTKESREGLAKAVLRALERTGRRAVFLSGWGELGVGATPPEGVFAISDVPHRWLFERVSAAVHHGGAGTTAASIRAGIPTVTVPFFADQPFWGSRVAHLKVGPRPIPRKALSAGRLADAIDRALNDEGMRARAARLGERVRAEEGARRFVEALRSTWVATSRADKA